MYTVGHSRLIDELLDWPMIRTRQVSFTVWNCAMRMSLSNYMNERNKFMPIFLTNKMLLSLLFSGPGHGQ